MERKPPKLQRNQINYSGVVDTSFYVEVLSLKGLSKMIESRSQNHMHIFNDILEQENLQSFKYIRGLGEVVNTRLGWVNRRMHAHRDG